MCQTLENMCCQCASVRETQYRTHPALIVCSEMCAFVLIHALNGHTGIRVGLRVCFSQPSLCYCGTWVIFI